MAAKRSNHGTNFDLRFPRARLVRLTVSLASLALALSAAMICAYYLITSVGYLAPTAQSVSSAWDTRVESAGAYLQAIYWARPALLLGVLSLFSYPFARLRGLTLSEELGLVSRDCRRVAATWVFGMSSVLLGAVSLLNYYANAATWAIRWNSLQLIQLLGLTQLNAEVYKPIGMLGGVGEIAKWFGILLALAIVSFFMIRSRLGVRRALWDSSLMLLAILLFYEVGLALLCWNYDYEQVTGLQIGTPMRWFTNVDLLLVSGLGVSGLLLFRMVPLRRVLASRRKFSVLRSA